MSSLRAQFDQLGEKFKALDKNIQRVLLLGIAFLLYSLVDSMFVQPMLTQFENVSKELEKTTANRKLMEQEIRLVAKEIGANLGQQENEQLETLKKQVEQLDNTLKKASSQFVTANEMIEFLNDLLAKNNKLELVSMEKLPLEYTVLKTLDKKDQNAGKPNPRTNKLISEAKVFRHGIKFKLSGRYVEIVKYLQAVERLSWRIFWETSHLNVENYPRSTVTFEIYTLSLDESWLTL